MHALKRRFDAGEGGCRVSGRFPFLTICTCIICGLCLFTVTNSTGLLRRKAAGQVKRAILLSSQDTGSTWVNGVLDSVAGVSFRGERLIGYSYKSYDEWLERLWPRYKWQLEKSLETDPSDGIQLVGFKIMYDQIPQQLHRPFVQWLNDNQIYVIHLRRRAAILQMASHSQKVQAKLSGVMKEDHVRAKHEDEVISYPKLEFDPRRDVGRIRQLEQNQRDFADYLHVHAPLAPQIELWYEHLDGPHKAKWFNALFAFLGLDMKITDDVGSELVKLGARKCDDRIEGLHGPDYENLQGLDSQRACAMLYWLSENETEQEGSSSLFYPPKHDKCRLAPSVSMQCIDPTYNASAEPGKL